MKNKNQELAAFGEPARNVILHYHFFKNAGTSIDSAFKSTLGNDKWVTREFESDLKSNRLEVHDWIDKNRNIVCFSSHTAPLPPPEIENTRILPVVFIRHPIDRIASVYSFERNQDVNSFGANLAKESSFAGYVETRLSKEKDYQCRNFHAHRLSQMDEDHSKTLEERANYAVDSLNVVGLVEAYDESLSAFNSEFRKYYLSQLVLKPSHKNATRSKRMTLDQKISEIRSDLGSDIFNELVRVNKEDLEIYKILARRYGLSCSDSDLCN